MALGLLQGATELVPVSSSAHLCVVPRMLGFAYPRLGHAERKSFEVALHLGSAPALALAAATATARPRSLPLALTVLPAAVAGLALERPIERHLGGPRTVAVAQLAGGAALWLADRAPGVRSKPDVADHLAVGVGQALALAPGVSRAGAALTAARLRGLARPAAAGLALQAALPVTAGAAALKGFRLAQSGLPEGMPVAMVAGAGAAFVAGVAARGVFMRVAGMPSYAPLAAYRVAFGVAALAATGRSRLTPVRPGVPPG